MMRNAVRPGEDGGVRGVLRKRDRSESVSPGGEGGDVRPSANKRRKTVAWRDGEELVDVLGCAESEVDRTPFDEAIRCGGCGLHCVGRMYACQLCTHDDFVLCAVCFSAHVRMTAALDAARAEHDRAEEESNLDLVDGPGTAPTSPAACLPVNPGTQSDIHDILESAAALADAAEDDSDEPMDEEEDAVPNLEGTLEGTRSSSDEEHSSEGEEDLIDLNDSIEDELDANDDGTMPNVCLGVHEHSPTAFLRQGCEDQEMLEEMLHEKRLRQLERELEAAAAVAAEREAEMMGGTVSEVTVTETGGVAPKEGEPAPVWDYRADII